MQPALLHRNRRQLLLRLATLAAFAASVCAAQMPPPAIAPETISMGPLYNGARLHIEGTAPGGADVMLTIRGEDQDQFFNRKSRIGILWLNSDRIHIQHAPSILLGFSSNPVGEMLSRKELDKYGLDETAILHHIRCLCRCKCDLTEKGRQSGTRDSLPGEAYRVQLESEFIRLKEADGEYSIRPGSLNLAPVPGGNAKYILDLDWPGKFPPGAYRVSVYACSHKEVIANSTRTLRVAEAGFPERTQQLAFGSPWLYGAGAVLIALLAGFATDLFTTQMARRRRRTRSSTEARIPDRIEEAFPGTIEDKETEASHRH